MTTRKQDLPEELLPSLLSNYKKPEDLIGQTGLLKQLTKRRVDRGRSDSATGEGGHEPCCPVRGKVETRFRNPDRAVCRGDASLQDPVPSRSVRFSTSTGSSACANRTFNGSRCFAWACRLTAKGLRLRLWKPRLRPTRAAANLPASFKGREHR